MKTIVYISACVIIPIAWGWLVDWAFMRFNNRPGRNVENENSKFVDYQI